MFKKYGILLLTLMLVVVGCGKSDNGNNNINDNNKDDDNNVIIEEPKLQIIDVDSKTRPIAVMIDNHPSARPNHTGLQDAYIVYEIIVEGGFTRYMAIFKDQETEKIGPVRSARHYYLDYALENDAIYAHFGWSPKAESDIRNLKVNNINGLSSAAYWRDKNFFAPHNAFTSVEKLKEHISKLSSNTKANYERETTKKNLFDYSIEEIDLSVKEDFEVANNISIKYSSSTTTSYVYDSVEKVYKRFVNNKDHTDNLTKEQYTAKNIIVYKLNTISLDNTGRRDIKNIGSGSGYYISNGISVPIKWQKDTRTGQTIYTYENGESIVLNDGNTYIQILPLTGVLEISE